MDAEIRREVRERLGRIELSFNEQGTDRYGISRDHLMVFLSILGWFYRRYFRTRAYGMEHVPTSGRAMLVGNHSGGYAIDAGMVIASCFFELEPPRLAQGMVEKFISRVPFAAPWANRTGQHSGLPEHAERLLRDEKLLMVFPEGARGTAKLFTERYSLVKFGTGFVRLALQTGTPIVPLAFVGGGEALPTVANLYKLGRFFGAPYLPVTPYLLPIPLPVATSVHYGKPMVFEGTGDEEDAVVLAMVGQVKERIAGLIEQGRSGGER